MSMTFLATQPTTTQEMDRGQTIRIASGTILGVTVLIFIARQFMKAKVFRKLAVDDFFILAATIFAIGLSLTTCILASKGLGSNGFLSVRQNDILMKGYYASQFLYVSAICLAKLSILVLFHNIVVVHRLHRRFVLCFGIFIFTWSIGSLFAIAFQCELPRPWKTLNLQCFNSRTFWITYCIIDIATEISIIMLSVNLVASLRVRFSRKVAVVACFAPRGLVIATALIRLIWLYPVSQYSEPQYRLWLPTIIVQLQICLSICTASIPYMVPYFKSMEGNVRRTYAAKGRDLQLENGRSRSFLSFRRREQGDVLSSWDSTAAKSLPYEIVPQSSPYTPTPRAMSPLTPPPPACTPVSTLSTERSLSINIPDRYTWRQRPTEIESPRTVSSVAVSPACTSPDLLISKFTIAAPTPPRRIRHPNHSIASPGFSDDSPTVSATSPPYRFHLFPPQPSNLRSPQARQDPFVAPSIPPIRAPRSQRVASTTRYSADLNSCNSPCYKSFGDESSKTIEAPKLNKAHPGRSPPPTPTPRSKSRRRTALSQDIDSPMWAAINHYFHSTRANGCPETPATRQRDSLQHAGQQVLSPSEISSSTSRTCTPSPIPHNILCNDLCRQGDMFHAKKTWNSKTLPPIRDV